MLILILYIALWIFLYYLEGFHDAFITLETNEYPPAYNYVKANYYKGKWHKYDTYSYAIFHIAIALLVAFTMSPEPFTSHFLTLALIFISVSIRIVAHDLFYDIGMNRSIFTIPTCQGSWDWWDCFIVWIDKKLGVPPLFLRFIPLFISISFYYLYFINGC